MGEEKQGQQDIVYHVDTSSVVAHQIQANICFSWEKPIEELTSKEINPHVVLLEPIHG